MHVVLRVDNDQRGLALRKEDLFRMAHADDFTVNPYFKWPKRPFIQCGFYTDELHAPREYQRAHGSARVRPQGSGLKGQVSSLVHAAFFFEDFTTASMNAMPRTPSSIFG